MPEHETDKSLSEPRRKEIFLALVGAQDEGLSVAESKKAVAQRFGVSESKVREIESEGLENEWPPL